MLPYWLLFALFCVGSFFGAADLRRQKPLGMLWVGGLTLILMIGLRWEIGPDWDSYHGWWTRAAYRGFARYLRGPGTDPGFYAVMWSFRNLGAPFWLFNLTMAAAFVIGLIRFARTMVNPWLATAIAVPYLGIVMAMSGIRQAAAIGMVLFGLVAFQRQQGWKFLASIAVAASLHASSILVLPLAGLSFVRNRFQAIVLIVIIAAGAYYLLGGAFDLYSERYFARSIQSSGTLYRIVMNLLPALVYLLLQRHFPAEPHERLLWRNMSITALLTLPAYFLVFSSTALDRFSLYLFPLQIYVLSAFPLVVGKAAWMQRLTLAVLAYLALQLFFFLNFGLNQDFYVPYRTVLSAPETR
jgi:hypothetical protein